MAEACPCVKRHSPPAVALDSHHVVPRSWHGPDTEDNRILICVQCHHSTHHLLNEYVRAQGRPPTAGRYNRLVQRLAARAWVGRPEHPTFTLTHPEAT